jgi:hypothetical protein
MTPTQNQKVTFYLSILANQVNMERGPNLEERLYEIIKAYLAEAQTQQQLGRWEIAWGPAVLESNTTYFSINAMYLAHSLDDPSAYVLAVAGTNSVSIFDWLVEDLAVVYQLPWIYGLLSAPDARISLGTGIGLAILQRLAPGGDRPGAGTNIRQYLAGLPAADRDLCVTGHSLGGALSPTLALWLNDTRRGWDLSGKTTLSTLPTAGPTAGNSPFAAYSDGRLTTTRFANSLDVVPHAWNVESLAQIKNLYAPTIPSDSLIDALVDWAVLAATGKDYRQIQAEAPPIQGTVDPDFPNFLAQVAYQHGMAYLKYFSLTGDIDRLAKPLEAQIRLPSPALRKLAERVDIPLPADLAGLPVPPGRPTVPVAGMATELPATPDDPRAADIARKVIADLEAFEAPKG